jgi:hypothetical protein
VRGRTSCALEVLSKPAGCACSCAVSQPTAEARRARRSAERKRGLRMRRLPGS